VSIGLLGGGGAVLAVPVLIYVLGEDPHVATTASLLVVLGGAGFGAVVHAGNQQVCWRHAASFVPPAAIGVAAGTVANDAVSGGVLVAALVPVLLVAAVATWRRGVRRPAGARRCARCGCASPASRSAR
jgi:uncharacterized membrane protein YfcA